MAAPTQHEAAYLAAPAERLVQHLNLVLLGVHAERAVGPLVARLGGALTSPEAEAERRRAVRLLGEVTRRLPEVEADAPSLASFYASRMSSDRAALPELLFAARVLVATRGLAPGGGLAPWADKLLRAVAATVEVPALPQAARREALGLLAAAAPGVGGAEGGAGGDAWFARAVIEAVDGEKDPRNLVACFSLAAHCLRRLRASLDEELLEELFDVTSCYFPITFSTPPAGGRPAPVSGDELRVALRAVLASHEGLAPLVVPLLVEKAGVAQEAPREDALLTLAACARAYGGAALRAVGVRAMWPALMADARPLRAVAETAGAAFVAPLVEACLDEALGAEPGAVSARQHGALLARGLPRGTLPASAWTAWRGRVAAAEGAARGHLVELAAALLGAHGPPPGAEADAVWLAVGGGGDGDGDDALSVEAAACLLRLRPRDARAIREAARHEVLDRELGAAAAAGDVLAAGLREADARRLAGRWPELLDSLLGSLGDEELLAAVRMRPEAGEALVARVMAPGGCPAAVAGEAAARAPPALQERLAAWAVPRLLNSEAAGGAGGGEAEAACVAALRPGVPVPGADGEGAEWLPRRLAAAGHVAAAAALVNKGSARGGDEAARALAGEHALVFKALAMRGAASAGDAEAARSLAATADYAAVVDAALEWPHSRRSPLYAQRFFAQALPRLVEGGRLAEAAAMMPHLPAAALRPHLAQVVVPAVLAGADDAVEALGRLLEAGCGAELGDAVGAVLERLLDAGCGGAGRAEARCHALRCAELLAGPAGVPYHRLHPLRGGAVRRLAAALDDPRRAVRRAAVRCRTAWFAAGGAAP